MKFSTAPTKLILPARRRRLSSRSATRRRAPAPATILSPPLKLLVARHYLEAADKNDGDALGQKVARLEADLKDSTASDSLAQSRRTTLAILKQRLSNFQNRSRILEEIDSDLTRIESQVDLALENASIQGKPQTISTEIELASDLVSGTLFGESESAIAALDHTYAGAGGGARKEAN